jgi:hypothetical protein
VAESVEDDPLSVLRGLFLRSADYARNEQFSKPEIAAAAVDISQHLKTMLASIAATMARSGQLPGWTADEANPGYLICADGTVAIHAPFNAFSDFPPRDVWREVASLVDGLRASDKSVVCLSGSSAQYGAVQHVSDLDLCEYVANNRHDAAGFLDSVQRARGLQYPRIACWRIRVDHTSPPSKSALPEFWRRPWADSLDADEEFEVLARDAIIGKCDFVASTKSFGALELSNFVFILRDDGSASEVLEGSFPFQETPMTGGAMVPRTLFEPREVGRYIEFLRNKISKHMKGHDENEKDRYHLCKAVKRALSLTRMLFRGDLANSLLRDTDQSLFRSAAEDGRRKTLQRLHDLRAEPQIEAFCKDLENELARTARQSLAVEEPVLIRARNALAVVWAELGSVGGNAVS